MPSGVLCYISSGRSRHVPASLRFGIRKTDSGFPSANKAKFLLDAASAKITVNGKPAEFKALKAFSRIHLKMDLKKVDKLGIDIDGVAIEIKISTEDETE